MIHPELQKGERLRLGIVDLMVFIDRGESVGINFLPDYKFYTELVVMLLEIQRQVGGRIKNVFIELKSNLHRDLNFERKIRNEMRAAYLQFLMVSLTTWGFIFFAQHLMQLPLSLSIGLTIFFLQILGLLFFKLISKKIYQSLFAKFGSNLKPIYFFTLMIDAGIPLNRAEVDSKIWSSNLFELHEFEWEAQCLKKVIIRLREQGISPLADLAELINGLWEKQGEVMETFIKKLGVLKFSVLVCFYLSAYFLYLVAIFQFFMEQ